MPTEMINNVEMVYGQAMLEMAEQSDRLDEIAEELAQIGELCANEPDVMRLLSSQVLGADERAAALDRIFNGRASDLAYRFLLVVNRKGRLGSLPGIIRAFASLYAEKKGIVEVDIHVADRLDSAKLESIAKGVGEAIGHEVVPHQHVDEHLIGGLKLRIGDQLIDGSVVTQLKLLQQKMVASGRDKAAAAIVE